MNDPKQLVEIFWRNVDDYRRMRKIPWKDVTSGAVSSSAFRERRNPTLGSMIKIANRLNVPLAQLLSPEFLDIPLENNYVIRVGDMHVTSAYEGHFGFVEDLAKYGNAVMLFDSYEQAKAVAANIPEAEVELW